MNNQEDLNNQEQETVAKFNLISYFEENKKKVLMVVGGILVLAVAFFRSTFFFCRLETHVREFYSRRSSSRLLHKPKPKRKRKNSCDASAVDCSEATSLSLSTTRDWASPENRQRRNRLGVGMSAMNV